VKSATGERAERLYSEIYDVSVSDWPGELAFYYSLADQAASSSKPVLEIGCGTGRVTIPMARRGINITGLDSSEEMLEVARQKSVDLPNVEWIQGDMRAFDLGKTFGLAIISGHSFQHMLTPGDQINSLNCIRRHLAPDGKLVVHLDHQDIAWLGKVAGPKKGVFEPREDIRHPSTRETIRTSRAWAYDPLTQTATSRTVWEIVSDGGQALERIERNPILLHCIFRFEMDHLFRLTNYHVEGVYGDFFANPLGADSEDMIWVATLEN
jgi:SAM-dependent methyltransferase